MALTPGKATHYPMPLRVGGNPLNIPPTATLTAKLMSTDGARTLVGPVPVSPTALGADWTRGLVVVNFSSSDTASITDAQVLLQVTVTISGDSQTFDALLDVAGKIKSALFIKNEVLDEIRANRLLTTVSSFVDVDQLTDSYLWGKIQAAEADASRQLRTFFEPTYCIPFPTPDSDTSMVPEGMPWVEEPGYDYEPDLFQGEGWGYLLMRHKPIISVDYVQFAYPQPMNTVWDLPHEWLRLDKKYGQLRIVPAGTSYSAPFSAWMMQVLGGGRNIPQMIRIRYKAGLTDAKNQFPELVDVVKKMAVLRIVEDMMPGSSESISADGLSQSKSINLQDYRDAIEAKLGKLSEAIHGVKMMVF